MIVDSGEPVTLVGGAEVSSESLSLAMMIAPGLVAADGGADRALALGHVPTAVIGDFDSISDSTRAQMAPQDQHIIPEQETTDFDKSLRNIRAPLVIGVGFLGARLDHQLAALNTLVAHPEQPCLLLGRDDLVFLCPPRIRLEIAEGDRVSLFPMQDVEVASEGLRWETDGLTLAPNGRVGTSNRATGPVTLGPDVPGLLVILPVECLAPACSALMAAKGWARGEGSTVRNVDGETAQ